MRIFQLLEATSNAAVPDSRTWYRNLYEPLIDLHHDVLLFPVTEGRRAMQEGDAAARGRFSEKLVAAFRTEHERRPFDLFFSYVMDGMIETAAIDEIRSAGVPTCNFSCNNTHQFDLVDEISPHFDFNLHSEKDVADKFRGVGAHPVWWPMASNPNYFKPQDLSKTVPVSFVGANYATRARYCAYLLDHGVEAHLYGPGWQWGARSRWRGVAKRASAWALAGVSPTAEGRSRASAELAEIDLRRNLSARFPSNVHPPVSDDELVALYSRSQISLGFLEVFDGHDSRRGTRRHLHLREFEAPMSGALYCTGYMDELTDMFEPDKEVLVYRNQYELLDKVKFYLTHPAESEEIRLAGRRRALRDHTYHRRFQQLFATVGVS
jgi:spore maturation protein CgeB